MRCGCVCCWSVCSDDRAASHTQIWIAAGVTDLRRGFTGLSALVQIKLEQSPLSGQVFVFRGRRGDLIKVLWFDGDGLCLFCELTGFTLHLFRLDLKALMDALFWLDL